MKKLMIAAALAAMTTGAFAVCGDDPTPTQTGRTVYKFTYSGKTTDGKYVAGAVNMCGDVGEACYARIPATLKIEGWVALCETQCTALMDAFNAPAAQAFWTTKPYKGDIADAKLGLDLLNIIGAKPNKSEAAGKFTGTVKFAEGVEWALGDALVYAGLGSYKSSTGIFTSISGNFAGEPVASWYISNRECAQSVPYDCQTLALDCENKANTVAYGKWSMKYSSSDTKKLYKGTFPKTPAYATIVVAE